MSLFKLRSRTRGSCDCNGTNRKTAKKLKHNRKREKKGEVEREGRKGGRKREERKEKRGRDIKKKEVAMRSS